MVDINSFQLGELLGEGSFGKVYKAVELLTNKTVAVKVLIDQDTGEVEREIATMRECQSPHIVQYYASFQQDRELWIVMEYCAGSSLHDIMEATERCLTETQIGAVMAGALDGLLFLHRSQKIHRDVKAGNLLLAEDGQVKLADFGVTAQLGSTISKRGTVIGTPFWMAPEVIAGGPDQMKGYNEKADVWSLGITAIELAEGSPPNASMHPMRAIFLIPTQPPPKLGDSYSPPFAAFVAACLVKEADERPSTSELATHPFVAASREGAAAVLSRLVADSIDQLRAWRLRNAESAARTSVNSVSYTHLTLPTILLV